MFVELDSVLVGRFTSLFVRVLFDIGDAALWVAILSNVIKLAEIFNLLLLCWRKSDGKRGAIFGGLLVLWASVEYYLSVVNFDFLWVLQLFWHCVSPFIIISSNPPFAPPYRWGVARLDFKVTSKGFLAGVP